MKLLLFAQAVLAAIGCALLIYCGAVTFRARHFQKAALQTFAGQAHPPQPVPDPPVADPHPPEGAVIAKLTIPSLNLSSAVIEGVSDADLSIAPGHVPGTAMPGEPGNVAIAGHRDTFFRPLRLIRPDQVISLATSRGEHRYRVISTEVVDPRDVRVLYPTGRDTLTLVTCFPFYFVGHAPKRFIVHADGIP